MDTTLTVPEADAPLPRAALNVYSNAANVAAELMPDLPITKMHMYNLSLIHI